MKKLLSLCLLISALQIGSVKAGDDDAASLLTASMTGALWGAPAAVGAMSLSSVIILVEECSDENENTQDMIACLVGSPFSSFKGTSEGTTVGVSGKDEKAERIKFVQSDISKTLAEKGDNVKLEDFHVYTQAILKSAGAEKNLNLSILKATESLRKI